MTLVNDTLLTMIHPVILSGGSGTRLWPLSRRSYPKQLLALTGGDTLLQQTVLQVADTSVYAPPLVICNDEHRFVIAEQLQAIDIEPAAMVLEPAARNTAPAIAAAAVMIEARDADGVMLVLPSDHNIADPEGFGQAVGVGRQAALDGSLVTFGAAPERPETGYGYIKSGDPMAELSGCQKVERFVEKPDAETAERYLADGGYSWNCGIFMFRASVILAELTAHEPELVEACRDAVAGAQGDLDFTRLDEASFARAPSISIDNAVMEQTKNAVVVPTDIGWSDVGSWAALWREGAAKHDEAGNLLIGDVAVDGVKNSYIRSEKRLVAVLGLDDVVVVETADAVLVADKGKAHTVGGMVAELKATDRAQADEHTRTHRPWGYYEAVDNGNRFGVKHICVYPGKRLSLQKHHHRAEHWVVVQGTARVQRGEETILLEENQSTYIPLGVVHRLENPGKIDLRLIEVQSGAYLGEDDIERLEDDHGRS